MGVPTQDDVDASFNIQDGYDTRNRGSGLRGSPPIGLNCDYFVSDNEKVHFHALLLRI